MGSLNKVMLLGNLGADPEIRYTPSGTAVANFQMATHERWTSKDGEKQERTEWHRVVAWRRLGEIAGEYLHKGNAVFVEGRNQTRQWEDRDGNKRYTTEVIATNLQLLGNGGGANRPPAHGDEDAPEYEGPADTPDDDIPF